MYFFCVERMTSVSAPGIVILGSILTFVIKIDFVERVERKVEYEVD